MAPRVRFYPSALRALLKGPDGPVAKHVITLTVKVHAKARRDAPVDSGRLRGSIRWSLNSDSKGIFGVVGTDVDYAIYVHDGTRFMKARPFLLNALKAIQQ